MAMDVTDDLVRQVATLSRLALSPEESAGLKEHFGKILAYIEEFQALDTKDVDPSHFSVGTANIYRGDESRPSLPAPQALANAPRSDGTYFLVPRIVGDAASEAGEALAGGGSA